MIGTVYLVGAGPGDPGLLTLAGRDALARADVVFYDALAHPALLAHCRPGTQTVFVGKRAEKHFVRQEETNALIADAALSGKTIVRLKGGDPFVFGRGGEECEYLRARGVPYVVVPGVTSAIAAPAYAGIPVTHRDVSSSFAVITGHERRAAKESGEREGGAAEGRRRWERIAHAADTLIFLMGVESLEEICAELIAHGREPNTPVALVQWGTWPRQRVVAGTLDAIAARARAAGIAAPAVTVVGDVVRYRETLRWFDTGPLFGKRIVVTRAREQASALAEKLQALGADSVEFPTIRIVDPDDGFAAADVALATLPAFDWVVFTSANGVERFFARLAAQGKDTRGFGPAKVAAVGPATAELLLRHGLRPDFVPTEAVAEALADQFPEPVAGKRLLLPRAQEARDLLPTRWREAGAQVDAVPVYRTVPEAAGAEEVRRRLAAGEIDAITFTSASTVTHFVEALGAETVPESVRLVAIGPVTAQACQERLRAPDAVAETQTLDGLVAALQAVESGR